MSENVFDKALISDEEWSKVLIGRLSSRPNAQTAYGSGGYDAKAMKAAFDAQGNLLKERHNTLVNYARAEEGARAVAESERRIAENERNLKEQERINAEIERDGNEVIRQSNELVRGENEGLRQAQEDIRKANEDKRISNETSREARFSEMEKLVGDLPEALEAILALQESLIGGDVQ